MAFDLDQRQDLTERSFFCGNSFLSDTACFRLISRAIRSPLRFRRFVPARMCVSLISSIEIIRQLKRDTNLRRLSYLSLFAKLNARLGVIVVKNINLTDLITNSSVNRAKLDRLTIGLNAARLISPINSTFATDATAPRFRPSTSVPIHRCNHFPI